MNDFVIFAGWHLERRLYGAPIAGIIGSLLYGCRFGKGDAGKIAGK